MLAYHVAHHIMQRDMLIRKLVTRAAGLLGQRRGHAPTVWNPCVAAVLRMSCSMLRTPGSMAWPNGVDITSSGKDVM